MPQYTDGYLAFFGKNPKRIPHWEHISNPAVIELVTGIDPWEKPRTAALKFAELYRIDLGFAAPADDTPIPRPDAEESSHVGEDGGRRVRWGTQYTDVWQHGPGFSSIDEILKWEPLDHLDMTKFNVVQNMDYSGTDDEFYERMLGWLKEPEDKEVVDVISVGFYNTMFMWPLLTFGWELFLELVGGYPEETKRIMASFAEINRKVFRAFARTPDYVNAVVCHDDICMTAGPVCSPKWLGEYVYPYYEEFWDMVKAAGKRVVFMSDGNIDKVADDVAACGADGFVSEPYTDWKTIARKYPNHLVCGEGDNRILSTNDQAQIRKMVDSMVETARTCGGYVMCVGNHIPWDIPAEAVKYYLDYSREVAHR